MKIKIAVLLIGCLSLGFILTAPGEAIALEDVSGFEKAYQDYIFNLNRYQALHQNYLTAKNTYLAYKTLKSKTEATEATLAMLQTRDAVVTVYLTALRRRLAEATGVYDYEQNNLYLKLDSEVGWYLEHHDLLASAGSLEDLLATSDEAQFRYNDTRMLAYESIAVILSGKVENTRNILNQELMQLKNKLAEIREDGEKDTTVLDRWLLEAENKIARSQEKQVAADRMIIQIVSPNKRVATADNALKTFNQIKTTLRESQLYLKEANSHLKELIREIKIAD